jgi:hypothetical protein
MVIVETNVKYLNPENIDKVAQNKSNDLKR